MSFNIKKPAQKQYWKKHKHFNYTAYRPDNTSTMYIKRECTNYKDHEGDTCT